MTALIMFLPNIPSSASQHLPALFNIFSRMLFWDRERRAADPEPRAEDDEKSEKDVPSPGQDKPWAKLAYLLESEDEKVPELLHYFTFLYGLYPINFMSYIRKPQRYLRHANFPGADDLDIEPTEIRERSEPFRQLHLLHPNFFMLTIESELTDNNRWQNMDAADVVAECMALYCPGEDVYGLASRSKGPAKKVELNEDVPEHPLLDEETMTPYQSRHNSWRNTQSTAVASPTEYRHSGLQRKCSQTSQSMPSIADSPSLQPSDRHDSPTIPPQMMASHSNNQLYDMLNTQKSIRGSLYQSLTNDSVASLALSNTQHDPTHMDAYLASLARETIPRSPSLRPTTDDPNLKAAYLQREIQLLRNDLNFERYLKQQHLSHIGQLRRKQIKEARVEAETQNLLNTNRGLRSKLEEAKRANAQMRKETEKSKAHSRKWETELSAKLRVLREEQKKWNLEREELKRDLEIAHHKTEKLKQLVITSESRELSARQKMMSVESSLDELENLRTEVENLTLQIRKYEARDLDVVRAEESEAAALRRAEILEMKLRARDQELLQSKRAFEEELYAQTTSVKEEREKEYVQKTTLSQEILDSVLASSRHRIVELQKRHNHLLKNYTSLQGAYAALKEQIEQREDGEEALLGGGMTGYRSGSPSPPAPNLRRAHASSDPDVHESGKSSAFSARPARLDTSSSGGGGYSAASPVEGTPKSPVIAGGSTGHQSYFHAPKPFSPSVSGSGKSMDADSLDMHGNVKKKIQPTSEVRVYGRGKQSSAFSCPLCFPIFGLDYGTNDKQAVHRI
jgi:solute carrier family 25 protein 16